MKAQLAAALLQLSLGAHGVTVPPMASFGRARAQPRLASGAGATFVGFANFSKCESACKHHGRSPPPIAFVGFANGSKPRALLSVSVACVWSVGYHGYHGDCCEALPSSKGTGAVACSQASNLSSHGVAGSCGCRADELMIPGSLAQ